MKILSLSSTDIWPFGKNKGIPSIFASQKGFVERGHQVYFLCPLKKRDLLPKEDMEGITIHRFKLPFYISCLSVYNLPRNNFWNHCKSFLIYNCEWYLTQIFHFVIGIKIARRMRPDLIYVHGLAPVFCGWMFSKFFRTKLIVRVYGSGYLYWRWDNIWYRIKEFRDYIAFKFSADYHIITNDGTGAQLLAKKLGVPEEKIKCWRNGIDESIYQFNPDAKKEICEQFYISPSSKIIVSTSRLIPIYQVDKLLFALSVLLKKNVDIICLIAGSGFDKGRLHEFVKKTNISKNVRFLGTVDHKMIKKLLDAADIYVSLPKYHNCTNSMWEAMAAGKCILTTENVAIREVLTSRINGILLSPDKTDDVTKTLLELLTNDELRNRLGHNARLRAKEVLESWPQRIEKEAKLLEQLVNQ